MDSDQEVVREPFEDQESIPSNQQSPDDISRRGSIDGHLKRSHNDGHQLDAVSDTKSSETKPDSDQINDDNDEDEEDTSLNGEDIEDVKFAKSFGIKLKGNKNELAYEQLMKSDHFVHIKEGEQSGQVKSKPKPPISSSVTSDCIYHKGTFYQKGDIVALCDQEDGQLYFAQLTGFLQDQYCEKSASVNWLVPTKPTSRDFFDPAAYRLGLEDLRLRKLDCMTFVRHCPHDYYFRKYFETNPPPEQPINVSIRSSKDQNYVWTTMEPCHVPACRYN